MINTTNANVTATAATIADKAIVLYVVIMSTVFELHLLDKLTQSPRPHGGNLAVKYVIFAQITDSSVAACHTLEAYIILHVANVKSGSRGRIANKHRQHWALDLSRH